MKRFLFLLLVIGLFQSCKKEMLETIPTNQAPNDYTVELTTVERYITRTYILTIGREPDSLEFNTAMAALVGSNLDSISRNNFLNNVFSSASYLPNLFEQNKIDLLNNVDTSEFTSWIFIFNNYLQDTTYSFQWPFLQFELDRMLLMQSAFSEFTDGTIDIKELQKRMSNNYLYDQINMGSANFVISTFQHLINRNPTISEQANGIAMAEGNNGIIFLQTGSSKIDYLDILIHSGNYYEAQIVFQYQKYLSRLPSSYEMASGTQLYYSTNNYTAVQKLILSSNEFIGIQ